MVPVNEVISHDGVVMRMQCEKPTFILVMLPGMHIRPQGLRYLE